MFMHKLKLFWSRHWLWILLALLVVVSVLLPAWYMAGMEASTRKYIIAMNISSLPWGIFQTMVFVGFLYLLQYGGGFSRFKKTKIEAGKVSIRFSDVIGLGEAKREAWEVVQLIKDRSRVNAIGGKILKGVIMVGPPGCGKTLLAKAIASEADVPFLSVSGSEFVEVFVGVGAARVRKLFSQARQYAQAYGSCIVFIDEIEVIGRRRVLHDAFGGSTETNSTQNQLLVELDGLSDAGENIIVIGATNADEDVLDEALMRPGRFDRKIYVGKPNLEERERIFNFYLSRIKYNEALDVGRLARKAVGKTPAEIENIVKEAALIAARKKQPAVSYKEMSEAIERIELGVEHRLNLTEKERRATAYHEAGHLLLVYLTHPTNDVFKISIRQRGGVLGVVHSVPREEIYAQDRDGLYAHIRVALGGYAAEKIKFSMTGEGVSSDLAYATAVASRMVWQLGMGKSGLVGDFTSPAFAASDAFRTRLNEEVCGLVSARLAESEALLRKEWQLVEELVAELLVREEMDYDEIAAFMTRRGKPPYASRMIAEKPLDKAGLPRYTNGEA